MILLWYLISILTPFETAPIARVHYGGGGDWYGNKTSIQNIFRMYEQTFKQTLPLKEDVVRLSDTKLFSYPVLYLSGHGNVFFKTSEINHLREYLVNGGFLFIDDDFGLDPFIRREMKKVFPNSSFIELPFSHDIYTFPFSFPRGLPKIHEHHGGQPKGFGLYYQDRMVAFYSYNTDISDGCEDKEIHGHSESIRLNALKMGTNILSYALNN